MMMQLLGSRLPNTLTRRFNAHKFCAVAAQIVTSPTVEEPKITSSLMAALKPKEVVHQLDKYIVGQADAKRAVAIALRNRWRRHQLSEDLKAEVIPKNILMIGPTGCGKTEIARRIAKLCQAPFIKVEATKFTEVGFHGKDVDTIIRDLLDVSINLTKTRIKEEIRQEVSASVEERIIELVVGQHSTDSQRESFKQLLRDGLIEETQVEIEVPIKSADRNSGGISLDPTNPTQLSDFMKNFKGGVVGGGKREKRKLPISEARPIIEESESERLLEDFDVIKEAIASVEENGIVFIDEIDKLVNNSDYRGAEASSEGVQKDLLPLIEGSTISTKHGNVNTDFILFIAAGAFHSSKPSDLLSELQGRLPIRVTLKGLTQEDMYRILTEPVNNLIRQQVEMLRSEQVELHFTDDAIREIARVAFEANKTVENIGARRLHTVIERIVEEISFEAPEKAGSRIEVSADYVRERVNQLLLHADLRKYIL